MARRLLPLLLPVFACAPASLEEGLRHEVPATATHLASCDDPGCGNGAALPLGGDHCGETVACRAYDVPQARCRTLHNLEHGHALLLYRCADGCPAELERLRALHGAIPRPVRVILAPDPTLPTRFAAVVWGWGWQGDTLDEDRVRAVLAKQDLEAPEPRIGCAP